MRTFTYGVKTEPMDQRPIRSPKRTEHQRRWVSMSVHDEFYRLEWITFDDDGLATIEDNSGLQPYNTLWETLAQAKKGKGKWWLVGFNMTNAMQKANLMKALEEGRVQLPPAKPNAKRRTRSGTFTMNGRTFEIDLQIGGNKLKMLDWSNFGVFASVDGRPEEVLPQGETTQALRDYLTMGSRINVHVCRPTAAQLGWNRMRQGGLSRVIWRNPDQWARDLERKSYHGGRCEPYRLGVIDGITYDLDIKACYAAITKHRTLPIRMIEEYRAGLDTFEIDMDDRCHWIADCIIETDSADYPMRDAQGQVYYPTGIFGTALCWPELHHALRRNRVKKIFSAARYEAAHALLPYADWCIRTRAKLAEGDLAHMENAVKALFNASLGFTARKAHEWVPISNPTQYDWAQGLIVSPEDGQPVTCQVMAGYAEWLRIGGEPREAIPYLHATVCSWSRMELLAWMESAGRENVHYVDTDGLMVSAAGIGRIGDKITTHNAQAGDLTYGSPAGTLWLNGQKNYRLGDFVVCAGLQEHNHDKWKINSKHTTPCGFTMSDGTVRPWHSTVIEHDNPARPYTNEII